MPDADDEHAGRSGVERAGVADAALVEAAAELPDDIVAGDTRRLVDDGHAVDRRRSPPGHSACLATPLVARQRQSDQPTSGCRGA